MHLGQDDIDWDAAFDEVAESFSNITASTAPVAADSNFSWDILINETLPSVFETYGQYDIAKTQAEAIASAAAKGYAPVAAPVAAPFGFPSFPSQYGSVYSSGYSDYGSSDSFPLWPVLAAGGVLLAVILFRK